MWLATSGRKIYREKNVENAVCGDINLLSNVQATISFCFTWFVFFCLIWGRNKDKYKILTKFKRFKLPHWLLPAGFNLDFSLSDFKRRNRGSDQRTLLAHETREFEAQLTLELLSDPTAIQLVVRIWTKIALWKWNERQCGSPSSSNWWDFPVLQTKLTFYLLFLAKVGKLNSVKQSATNRHKPDGFLILSAIQALVWGLWWMELAVESGTKWNVYPTFLFDFSIHHRRFWHRFSHNTQRDRQTDISLAIGTGRLCYFIVGLKKRYPRHKW